MSHPVQTLPPPPDRASRVLIVDGSNDRRERNALILRGEGFEVDVCDSGEGLHERVQAAPPDLLLLSVPLPGADWVDLCGDLRTIDQARLVPIILLASDETDEETVVRGLSCGADDFITAPDRIDELKARVLVQLRHRRDRELLQWASAQRARFRTEALVDPLTGIGNRRAAEEGLARALEARVPLLLMLIDVDHFKRVNDTHGHAVGDVVLKGLAACLDQLARRGDVVARFGGEEFLLLLRGASPNMGHRIAQRFRRTIAELTHPEAPEVDRVTVSIGVATWSGRNDPPPAEDLLQSADEALYAAKRAGRDRVVVAHLDRAGGDFQVA
ncbi:MAG: diguanylate cyclase domain-containing protein [Myxococcota bacterium]